MYINNETVVSTLHKCNHIENNNVSLTSKVYMRSQIGFLNCQTMNCEDRMNMIIQLTRMKLDLVERVTGICKNKVLVKYDTSYLNSYTYINLIIIPNYLIAIWDNFIKAQDSTTTIHLFTQTHDIEKLNDVHFDTLVIPSNTIDIIQLWLKTHDNMAINKVILDSCDDNVLPSCMNVNYNFLWILHHGFIDQYIQKECSLYSKGFIKSIIDELFSEYTNYIGKHLIVECTEMFPKYLKVEKKFVESKQNTISNVNDALEKEDMYRSINYINPTIFHTNELANDHLLHHISSTINLIQTHIIAINKPFSNERFIRLHLKKKALQEKYDTSLARLNNEQPCNICIDTIHNKTILKCCRNSYCFICINKWLQINDSCPICKRKVNIYKDQILIPDVEVPVKYNMSPNNSIYENVIFLIKDLQDTNIVLFYTNPFIKTLLKRNHISYKSLKMNNNSKSKSNIVIANKHFLGCGMDYKFKHMLILEEVTELMDKKLVNTFNPDIVWYIK